MILPQLARCAAFSTLWMYLAFRSMPGSLVQSVVIGGASELAMLWRVLAPNVVPAVRVMAALVCLWTWNAFLAALVVISNCPRCRWS
jgi:ABC-type glycerol-3-phosphate transport system permease component